MYRKNNKLLIIGAGGHGRVVADIALNINEWNEIAFLDDDESKKIEIGLKIIGKSADIYKYIDSYDLFVAIGNNKIREKLLTYIDINGANVPTLIHPSAIIGKNVSFGKGTCIMAGAIVNCCSRIGEGCIINTGVTIDHDNEIDDYVHISPGSNLAGMVRVGHGSWLGTGSVIINNLCIGNNAIVGAGAVVIKDIENNVTVAGNPAKVIKRG